MRFAVILACLPCLWAQEPQRIRVTVERMDSAGWAAVNPAHVFESGDRIRFHFNATFAGYLYVTGHGTSGGFELLFPREDTGRENRIEAGKDYVIPASKGLFRVTGPPGHDLVYWIVSPVDLAGRYRPLPDPQFDPGPLKLRPRCDDSIFKARGECIDTEAGVKPVTSGDSLPRNMNGVVSATPRELMFIQDNTLAKESVVVASPAPLTGPVVYELRLAHR